MAETFRISIPPLPAVCREPLQVEGAEGLSDGIPFASLQLEGLLARFHPVPPKSVLMGVGMDEVPVFFDLDDPQPGPLLVLGNSLACTRDFLRVFIHSASRSLSQVKILVFSSQPESWSKDMARFIHEGTCLGVFGVDEPAGEEWMLRMAERTEKRQASRRHCGHVLLLLDDLGFLLRASSEVRMNFEWLCTNGPQARIWPVVALTAAAALELGRWLRYFRTRILGHMPDAVAARLGLHAGLRSHALYPGRQYAVRIADEWLRFWLPSLPHDDLNTVSIIQLEEV